MNTAHQTLWYAVAKAVLRGKFMALNVYVKKKKREKSQINDLSFHIRIQREKKTVKTKVNRKKKTVKKRTQINEIENNSKNSLNETKSSVFTKMNIIEKPSY